MLPDYHHQRQEQLARVLVATKETVECIAQYVYLFFDMIYTAHIHVVNLKHRPHE
jgi:hypothetical protein